MIKDTIPRLLWVGVAINLRSLQFDPLADLLVRERRIIGCLDHTGRRLRMPKLQGAHSLCALQ